VLDEDADGHALDRVEVHGAAPRNRVLVRVEDDLAGETADRGGGSPIRRLIERVSGVRGAELGGVMSQRQQPSSSLVHEYDAAEP